jgi:hypothetical protein
MMWITQQLNKAREKKVTVIGMMHHNLIEHIQNQNAVTPQTVIDNWQVIADQLVDKGLEVIFTGHSHANDISQRASGGKVLYDIATGSTIAFPSQYRMIILKNKEMDIRTSYVTDISEPMPGDMSFTDYGNKQQADLFNTFFTNYFKMPVFNMSDSTIKAAAPLAGNAYMAFFAGDENISPLEQARLDAFYMVNPLPTAFIGAANSLWTDLGVKDNKWHIKLIEK